MADKKLIPILLGGLGIAGLFFLMKKKEKEELLDDCDAFGPYDDVKGIWRWSPEGCATPPELSTNRVQGEYSIAMGKQSPCPTTYSGVYYYNQDWTKTFSLRGKQLEMDFYIEDLESLNLGRPGKTGWAIRFLVGLGLKGPQGQQLSAMAGGLSLETLRQLEFPGWVRLTINIPQDYTYIDDCHFIGFGFWTQDPEHEIPPGGILMDNWRIVDIK